MSLPDGVTTCLLTYGPITDTFGNLADSITVTVKADRPIVHVATGRTMFDVPLTVTAGSGETVQIPVPHVDQAGFRDKQQNDLTMWKYTVELQARFPSGPQTDRKPFQPLVGQTTRDADLLPTDAMSLPAVVVTGTAVTSVNGQTGAVVIGAGGGGEGVDLSADLGPFAAGKGILLTSPDGNTVQRLRIDNDGDLVTEDVGGGVDPEPVEGAPDSVAGLATWLDIDSLTLSNGDSVNLWTDSAGADDAIAGPGIANAPVYQTSGINGHPAVRFTSASDQAMQMPSAVTSRKPFTLLVALKVIDFADNRGIIHSTGGTSLRINQTTGLPNLDRGGTAGIGTATSPLVANVAAILTIRYDGSGAWAFWINGTAAGSGVSDNPLIATTAAILGNGMNGWLGEFVQYDTALSPTDRGSVETYLINRWSIA